MARRSWAHRLYAGEISYDFVAKRKIWYAFSGALIVISIISLAVRGINPSIDFKGGAVFEFPGAGHTVSQATDAVSAAGVTPQVVQQVGEGRFRVETGTLSNDQVNKVESSIASKFGVSEQQIASSTVGATWGGQITRKALTGLVAFLIAVVLYLSVRYEPKMAGSAIVALLHDLLITAGIYSLVGFQVSPETIIALLTILGYSLYDTVVVFDKVRENTVGLSGGSRMTLSDAANLAVNQTLVRSINTSVIGLLPVAGLLAIGVGLLGAGSLKDLSLAMLIGLMLGSYSSIFIATPLYAQLKEREPQFQQLARRVAARQAKSAAAAPAVATVGGGRAGAEAPEGGDADRGPHDTDARGAAGHDADRAPRDGATGEAQEEGSQRPPGLSPPPGGTRTPSQQPRRRRGQRGRSGRRR